MVYNLGDVKWSIFSCVFFFIVFFQIFNFCFTVALSGLVHDMETA